MGEHTKIEWCHHTFNPWRGCTRVSPGCDHCYAEAWSKRNPKQLGTWGDDGERVIAGDAYWRTPLRWDRLAAEAGERRRAFCASLADVFEDRPELEAPRERLFGLIYDTPNLDWLLLTKRPREMRRYMVDVIVSQLAKNPAERHPWPLPNLWLGVTCEDQERAGERIPILLDTPAAVRFVSYEPALGRVDWSTWLGSLPGVDWIIVGGESGGRARGFNIEWARETLRQSARHGVPVFVKQFGSRPGESDGRKLHRVILADKKGADPHEWPERLRVREIPIPAVAA